MSNHRVVHIVETPGAGRLGRHVEHDERSRAFAIVPSGPIQSVQWERHCPPFDQGNLGSCTGNAMCGAKMTGPLFADGDPILTEEDAVRIYAEATRLDRIPGSYPPDDTGSSGLAVARAARREGMIAAYHHAFGLTAALHALARGPVIIGIDWYDGFDAPEGDAAELRISGSIRGGHELCLDGIDVESGFVEGTNSWGLGWGDQGKFVMSFGTFGQLLRRDGDVVAPVK